MIADAWRAIEGEFFNQNGPLGKSSGVTRSLSAERHEVIGAAHRVRVGVDRQRMVAQTTLPMIKRSTCPPTGRAMIQMVSVFGEQEDRSPAAESSLPGARQSTDQKTGPPQGGGRHQDARTPGMAYTRWRRLSVWEVARCTALAS